MDSVSTYSVASLAWLASQAVPLIIWPSLVTTLLRVDGAAQGPQYGVAHVSLEQYFARSLGLSQLALGSLLLVLSGTLPLDSMADAPRADDTTAPTPYATAAVFVSALYHAATASYSYSRYYTTGGQLGYLFGCLGASVMAVFGLWVLMFAGPGNRRVSRRTGADKSTSGWPFRNAEADRRKRR
ncbi:hypothetical protein NEMBOFW57_002988 [Staphylotrichum longicolle]|uniref:Uncharacterized protein n=1 Tax=Staphylotrichum longicolle TaxID=669026 RepID=A0AAD4F918_9PEZI|nr:hypothetical protein NEMBOFW57_002988 [Staphylotrichum longicolle]